VRANYGSVVDSQHLSRRGVKSVAGARHIGSRGCFYVIDDTRTHRGGALSESEVSGKKVT